MASRRASFRISQPRWSSPKSPPAHPLAWFVIGKFCAKMNFRQAKDVVQRNSMGRGREALMKKAAIVTALARKSGDRLIDLSGTTEVKRDMAKSSGLSYEIRYLPANWSMYFDKNMPAAPPAIFSSASTSVPWRSGVSVCKISRRLAPPKTMQHTRMVRRG